MLNKIEFSDLYKFLTSVGLIIVASSVLVPWLLMKEEMGLSITTEEYSKLIESSKELNNNRIDLALTITKLIPWISGVLLIFGLIISGIGIRFWVKKQAQINFADDYKVAKLEKEQLDENEISNRLDSEIEPDIIDHINNNKTKIVKRESLKSNLIDLELLFYQKLLGLNPSGYRINNNIKVDGKYNLDLMLEALNNAEKRDILIEIKYLQNKLSLGIIKDSYFNFRQIFNNYGISTNRRSEMRMIVVYKNDIASNSEISNFLQKFNEFKNLEKSEYNNLDIIIMNDLDTENYDINKMFLLN